MEGRRRPRCALRRRMARTLGAVMAVAVAGCANLTDGIVKREEDPLIRTTPVPLDFADPDRDRVGRLRYRGGLALNSTDPRFGGLSGLLLQPDGAAFVAVSDNGYWIRANLIYDEAGNLTGIGEASITPMPGLTGQALNTSASERDAEALATTPDGGLIVAFERDHRLWRYQGAVGVPIPIEGPGALDAQPLYEGVEGLTTLAEGRLLAFSEGLRAEGGFAAWLKDETGDWQRLSWRAAGNFQPTGATTLPNGDVLLVERRYPPIGVRVRRIAAGTITPGAILEGEHIAQLDGSLAVDNMEAIDARLADDGGVRVYLLSDDNYSRMQTTLLMLFDLED